MLWAVEGDLEDVSAGEAYDAVLDVGVGVLDPRGDGVCRWRCCHGVCYKE